MSEPCPMTHNAARCERSKLEAEIERHIREKVELAGLVAKERARIEWLLDALATIAQSTPQNLDAEMLRIIAKAALAGKEGT